MRVKSIVLCSASTLMLALGAAPATAQSTPPPPPPAGTDAVGSGAPAPAAGDAAAGTADDTTIVVTGLRRSLQSAQNIRRHSEQIVDSVVAEDIGKLPDLNTAQTAARIPGVQVYRQGGEAQNVLVRGLPFFTTTYNGREIFTAETRVVALQDFPSSNIAALEVFKTSTADLVSPGLAGIVNVRSRKPFDFTDGQVSGSVWGVYTRQGRKAKPNANLLATKRWNTGAGEFGILVQGAYQDMRYLDAEISNTDFIANPTVNGQVIRLPDIQRLFYRSGSRGRPAANVQLQWKPSSNLEFYAEGLYQGFVNKIDDRLLEVPLYGASYSNLQFRDGTNLVRSGTATNPGGNLFSFQGGTFNRTDTFQVAAGTRITSGPFKLNIDVARSLSTFRGSTESIDRTWPGAHTVDFNNDAPSFNISGINFGDPSAQRFQGLYEQNQRAAGRDWQARADAEYDFNDSFLENIQVGVRYADHRAQRNFGDRYAFLLPLGINQTALPLQFSVFHGVNFQPTYNWAAPTYESIRNNLVALRQFVINQCPNILPSDPRNGCGSYTTSPLVAPLFFSAKEQTLAAYGQVHFALGDAVRATVGLRVQNSKLNLPNVPTGNGPVNINRSNTDYLPNANLTVRLPSNLQMRLAVSKTVTRPDFSQLGGITFGPPPSGGIGTDNNPYVGGGGNPFLQPFTSWNYDASLEYYFSRAGFGAVTVFHRNLDKFIINQSVRFNDPTLGVVQINGPANAGKGRMTGVEIQGQTFFDFAGLPSWLKSFGIQANLTYLDFKLQQQSDINGGLAYQAYADQLNGVSKWNYNLSGLFESGPISARLSYNGRSRFAATRQFRTAQVNGQTVLDDLYYETAHPADRLDLSLQYNVLDYATVFFDWTNITRKPFRQDFSSARAGATRADYVRYLRYDESTVSLGLRFKFGK